MKRPDRGEIIRKLVGKKPMFEIRDMVIMELENYIDYLEGSQTKETPVCPECGYPTFRRTYNKIIYCHGCEWTSQV